MNARKGRRDAFGLQVRQKNAASLRLRLEKCKSFVKLGRSVEIT